MVISSGERRSQALLASKNCTSRYSNYSQEPTSSVKSQINKINCHLLLQLDPSLILYYSVLLNATGLFLHQVHLRAFCT